MQIVQPEQFPALWLKFWPTQSRKPGNPGTRKKYEYKDLITAFDIETTRLREIEQSIMYIWMWSFGNHYIVIGRTWEEYIEFMGVIQSALRPGERLFCGVHNLSYEFHFLRGIHAFLPEDVFAIQSRKILRCTWGAVDYLCTYLHTNMSLAEYTAKMKVQHQKLSGDEFDYSKIRYPWTPITERELEYCINDVAGLVEALSVEMEHDGDDLYTLPATSTGYVRRDAKRAMRDVGYTYLHNQLPSLDVFQMLREAFRGGDCHANRFFAGQIVDNVHNADRSSSYPDIVCNCLFPVSAFFVEQEPLSVDEVLKLIEVRKRAVVMRCAISGLDLRNPYAPAPYLSRDKCRNIINGQWDNGRILSADYLETTLTDIDLRIVLREYKFMDVIFYDVAHARYGPLPRPLIETAIEYYKAKTELKGVDGQEVYYTKSKNKLNAIYGMMAQNPCRHKIVYTQEGKIITRIIERADGSSTEFTEIDYYPEDDSKTDAEILEDSNRRAYLAYQWGCWVTAWARYRLREGIWLVEDQGADFLYCDTDSVKYIGFVDWRAYNAERIKASKNNGAFATDPAGEMHYMGVFEQEHDYLQFKTLGAKKYVYTIPAGKKYKKQHPGRDIEVCCTISGVGKTAGGEELYQAGGIKAFRPGFVFYAAGGLEAVYNDAVDMWIEAEGRALHITPNVTLRESTYKVGLAGDYDRLLRHYELLLNRY